MLVPWAQARPDFLIFFCLNIYTYIYVFLSLFLSFYRVLFPSLLSFVFFVVFPLLLSKSEKQKDDRTPHNTVWLYTFDTFLVLFLLQVPSGEGVGREQRSDLERLCPLGLEKAETETGF